MLGHNRFGVELQAINGIFFVFETHDNAVVSPGRRFELVGQIVATHDERVVAGGHEVLWHASKQALLVVVDSRAFAVHDNLGALDDAPKGLPDGLMPEAHAEGGNFETQLFDDGDTNARLAGGTRPRRHHNPFGLEGSGFFDGDLVVTFDQYLGAQFAQILHQVVGKGVVVVDEQNHATPPSLMKRSASSRARKGAAALLQLSRYSISGSLSATTPPPACT